MLALVMMLLASKSSAQFLAQSTNDLWDISQGTVVTGTSGVNWNSDARDMFGGNFSPVETGDTIFQDFQPDGYVHYIEWQTQAPVTVASFALFAAGDGPQYLNEREFSKFVLKAKSSPAATNFDVIVYELDVTNHPYNFLDPTDQLLVATNITPLTAQYFRAEFTQHNAGRGWDAPRIMELDAYGSNLVFGPPVIATQPADQTVTAGSGATFSVGLSGVGPFSYQWRLNGDPLTAETNATLSIASAQISQSGNLYSVSVSNSFGSTNSAAALLTVNPAPPRILPSSTDLWDISQGATVTGTSGVNWNSDPRDMFGGNFSPVETGDTIFQDFQPDGYVHYIEWQTQAPVTVAAFALFATGDGAQYLNEREFSKFVLKAKSSPAATNFDLTLYELDVTNHPYNFVDPADQALVATDITPVTAQYFRAEFTQHNAGRGWDAPRILELDGYGTSPYGTNAPVIGTQPSDQTVSAGASASFNVGAFGAGPLSYQWLLNGDVLPLETNVMLTVTNVQLSQSGNLYSVSISNQFGSTNSRAALLTVTPYYPRSSNDLWDISQGAMVTGTSGVNWNSDARDMFGGNFSPVETGDTIFADGKPDGFVHYIEWQTPVPVTVDSFALFAAGDGPQYLNEREFSKFVLKARSSSDATNFDLTLYELDVTNHPYSFLDPADQALVVTNITPVTAQYFRAEFTQHNAGRGWDAPRIMELDGFGINPLATNAPAIVTQPADEAGAVGSEVSFSVAAFSLQPESFQWQSNSVDIPGATNATLNLANVQTNWSGSLFSVTVSNAFGATNSRAALLTVVPAVIPSTNDLWDISEGTVVTGTSGVNWPFSDIRDMFGGTFSPVEPGNTVFDNSQPPGFVHYVEWQTFGPVTVNSFALFAAGDGPVYLNEREFSKFVLKAKSSAAATNFDLTLYELDVTNHPYNFVDPTDQALVVTNITPVTAQYFRAEFTQYTAGRGYDSPRIIELDGFGTRCFTNLPPFPIAPPPRNPPPPFNPLPGFPTNFPPPMSPLPPVPIPPLTFINSIPTAASIQTSGSNIVVSWPASAPGYVLLGSTGGNPPDWFTVPGIPVTNGPVISLTLPMTNAPQFFRLVHP